MRWILGLLLEPETVTTATSILIGSNYFLVPSGAAGLDVESFAIARLELALLTAVAAS